MFDSLLYSKFYNKCKHAFKCIRTRMPPIRRKKQAMIRFMKKDVADLLANGLDTHAFGRMDGLIVELNRDSCYDMIEGFCDYIGKQLGSLQKQRECPPEFREAVSTLIFAAARYPDLPELCDLRHIFTERYGNFVEHFVSREFIRKLDSTEFSNEERFEVMQSVAEELSVSFDAKELQLKLWATPEIEHDTLEKGSRKPAELSLPLSSKQRCVEDAPYEQQEDILQKSSRKPAELAMPLFDKTKCDLDAPCERKTKDMLEKYSIKPVELATASSNKQEVGEDIPCKRNYDAEPAHNTEKVEIQLIQKDIQAVADAHHTIDENLRKQQPDVFDEKEHLQKPVSPVDTNRRNTQKDVQKLNRRAVRPLEKELMEAVELDLNGLPKNGFGAVKFPETEGNRTVQLNVKPNEAVRHYHIEKENNGVLHGSRMPGGPEHNGRHADSGLRAQRPDNQGRPVSPLSGNTGNKAPYTKQNVANMKSPTEKQVNNGFLHDKPQHLADLGYPVQKGQGVPKRAGTMLPPYVKPKSNMKPVNDDPEKQTPSGYSKPNIPGQTDHLENKDVLRPVSVRRRTAKLPAPVDADVEVPNNVKVTSQTPKSPRSHSTRQNGAKYGQNRKCNRTDDVGSGKNAQITPSSQSKHIGRRNGALNHNNDCGRLMQRRLPEADDTAIDFGNLLPRTVNGQRRHNSGRDGDLDDEERMMDKLLMHYSKKKNGPDPTNNETHMDAVQKVSLHPPGRAVSLPPESVGPGEDAKVPARSTSLQPDGPRSAHVHPKMPDFDELAARVKALRNA